LTLKNYWLRMKGLKDPNLDPDAGTDDESPSLGIGLKARPWWGASAVLAVPRPLLL
jgi:hypothetical protein